MTETPRQKRPFYIIAHNPNSIEEAKEFLNEGVNALEPDIVYADGQYYVCHEARPSYAGVPTLVEYLTQLKEVLLGGKYNLALIIWDLKVTDFDPNEFITLVKQHFSGGTFDGVTMLMTHSDDDGFVSRYKGSFANVGVGVDESDDPPVELATRFRSKGHRNISYASGITTFLNKPGIFKNIREAELHRAVHGPDSFGVIYTWVLSRETSMRRYLDTYIDGIMVDVPSVKRLRALLEGSPYRETYQLARNGHNPFNAPPIPRYVLTVKTKDKMFAGTDTRFVFTLVGVSGASLSSLAFHANVSGVFERDSTSLVTLEGADVGEIATLTIEAVKGGVGAGWLPERISVENKLTGMTCNFEFGGAGDDEWISKGKGPVTKLPSK
jgi:hypothetical protein